MSIIIKQSAGPLFEVTDKSRLHVRTQALICTARGAVRVNAGDRIACDLTLTAGKDYDVRLARNGIMSVVESTPGVPAPEIIGGGHFSPGSCALRYDGGDSTPQWNPFALWDRTWRPTCSDPRGMALVAGRFWCDIWLWSHEDRKILTNISALTATVRADQAGKRLPTQAEFRELALGVRERSAADGYDERLKLDAPRTSRWGVMQATGTRWIWLRIEADPCDAMDEDHLRAFIAGANWFYGANAGSRASFWSAAPSDSGSSIGARGVCDHLVLV